MRFFTVLFISFVYTVSAANMRVEEKALGAGFFSGIGDFFEGIANFFTRCNACNDDALMKSVADDIPQTPPIAKDPAPNGAFDESPTLTHSDDATVQAANPPIKSWDSTDAVFDP
jgi:hypothetical protein